ncbi:hypothetical protein CFN58_32015 [Pseudomonas avellanae]|uniref:Uncharacterized protein n=1 Tax=Pseudomonas avellanae TaxID=46257 RepID=A0A261WAW6_9PSED|nr:hypothetical protein CFN58_32015 [Pseudomonas avellanae]
MGANLFAKAVSQTMHFQRLYRPFREQVRSHALRAEAFPGSPGLMYNAERPVSGARCALIGRHAQ